MLAVGLVSTLLEELFREGEGDADDDALWEVFGRDRRDPVLVSNDKEGNLGRDTRGEVGGEIGGDEAALGVTGGLMAPPPPPPIGESAKGEEAIGLNSDRGLEGRGVPGGVSM